LRPADGVLGPKLVQTNWRCKLLGWKQKQSWLLTNYCM